MTRAILLIFLGLSFLTFSLQPLSGQTLSGTYTVGTADGSEDYPTISAALADLRAGTITGNIIYQIAIGTYHETIDLSSLNNGDYTITLSGVNQELTIIHPLDSIIADKSGISLANTNHVVLQNFTLEMDDISATKVDFDLNETKGINVTGASDITLKDLILTNDKFVASEGYNEFIASAVSLVNVQNISISKSDFAGAGLLVNLDDFQDISISNSHFSQAQSHISHFRTINTPADGLTIEGNSFTGPFPTDRAAAAIYLFGYSSDILSSSYSTNLTIENNHIDSKAAGSDDAIYGMYIQGQDGASVKNNRVKEGSFGIYLGSVFNSKMENNEVYRTSNRGLYIQQGNQLDVINNILTSNNAPIACITSSNLRIAHNTLYADGTEPALRVFGLSGDSLVVLNNIFSVENTAAAEVIITDVTASDITIDHNLYSENSPYAFATYRLGADIGKTNGLAYNATSLNDWQTYQALYSQNAQAFAPVFAGDNDYHITDATNYRFGATISDIVNDIDGDERSQSGGVDVGADQYLSDEGDGTNSGTSRLDDVTYELIQPATSPVIDLDLPKGHVGENLIYDMDGDGDNDFLFFALGPTGGYKYIAYLNDGKNHYQRVDLSHDFGISDVVFRPIIRVADFNQDGINDIILGGEGPRSSAFKDLGPTKVFFGDANGQLHEQSQIVLPSSSGGTILVEDFNNDTYPDIFLISSIKGKLYLNDGSGGFTEASVNGFTDTFVLRAAVSTPYNGGVDLVLEIFEDSRLKNVIYRYEGGAFTEVMNDFRTIDKNHSMAFGEANGDGYPDLLILDANQNFLYFNDQSGNYVLDTQNDFDGIDSWNAFTLHFTDLNKDGAAEIVFNKATEELAVFWNDGTGNYGDHQTYEISNVSHVTIGDLNGDGFPDIVNNGNTDVPDPKVSSDEFITRVYINDQENAFERVQFNIFPEFRNGDIQLLDANEDGHDDLLVSGTWYQGTQSITELYLNDGTGEFTQASGQPFEGLEHTSITIADFNRDMHEDVVISGRNQSDEVHTRLYLGDGAGNFSQDMSAGLSGVIGAAITLDANGDTHPDLLLVGKNGADALIAELYMNDGTGTLISHAAGLTGLNAVSVAVGDIDGDEDADLLLQGVDVTNTKRVLLFTNDGAGNFTEVTDHSLDALSNGKVLLFDIDGDDDLDIYLSGGGKFLIYSNNGSGTFTESQSEAGPSRSTAAFGDIDLDGDLDLVESGKYGTSGEPRTFVYFNNGNGNFTRESVGALHGIFDGAMALGDLDQDLDLEIMLSGAVWNQVTSASRIYRNTSGDATNNPPTITSVSLAPDNSYLDVTFSTGIYNTNGGSGALEMGDFILSIIGGSATNPTVTSVKKNDNTVEASASALVGGETTVRIFFNTTNTPDGAETLTVNPADGSSLFSVEGDAALSSQSNNTITMIDQLAPEKPVIVGISDDTGASSSDGITNDKNIMIRGTADPYAAVEVSSQFGPVRSTQADANGDWLLDITDITLSELTTNLTAEAVDLAGNRSETSNVLVLTPDFTAPVKPVITGISDDTGASNSDGITNDKNIMVSGTTEPHATVEVSSQFGPVRNTQADANGDWLLDITDITLFELTTNLTAEAVDLAGNRSETSDTFVLTPDFTAPAKPVITGISDDTGTSSSDGITNDKNIIVSGTAEPHATVEVSSQFGPVRSTQTDANGDWLLDITDITLFELTTNLTAEAVDLAGNHSETSNVFVLTPDFTAPVKPVITGISDDTGASSSDGITNDQNIMVSGTAEPHATVEVSSQFGPVRSTQTDASGDWLLDITDITLVEIGVNLSAVAIDMAGNHSEPSDVFVLTPDFTAPARPVITGITEDTGNSNSDGVTNDKNITISGTAEPDATVEISSQFGPLRNTQADVNGEWLLDITDITLLQIVTNLKAEAVDAAGNRSVASDIFVLTPDFTSPGVTLSVENSSPDGYTITALFDEAVSGLSLEEITVTNGVASNLVRINTISYSFLVSPSGGITDVYVNTDAAQDMAGNSNELSNQLTLGLPQNFTSEVFTDLPESPKAERLNLYPTPASSILIIDLSGLRAKKVDIDLYDMAGNPMFRRQGYSQQILKLDVSSWTNGMYIIQIRNGQQAIRNKVMVSK